MRWPWRHRQRPRPAASVDARVAQAEAGRAMEAAASRREWMLEEVRILRSTTTADDFDELLARAIRGGR